MGTQQSFDYIIVGAGAAGCVLAYRLAQDPSVRVLLIEAGGPDRHPFIHMPRGLAKIIANPALIWPFMTEAEAACDGGQEFWARGRTLGGSSSINGMVYVRGQADDYEELAQIAGPAWGWRHIGAAYRAFENHELGPDDTRGADGPLKLTLPPERTELTEATIEAGVALGLERATDVNAPEAQERIGYLPRTISQGQRQSAAVAFLKPVLQRPNLTVVTNHTVDRLIFDGQRAVGVQALVGQGTVRYRAEREVLLCAGALSSPAILQRSGVGPGAHLRALGIEPVCDSPDVGANLREHRGVVMQWRIPDHLSQNREFRGARLMMNAGRYFLSRSGPLTGAAYEVGAWFKSRPDAERPDGQILIAPFSFDYSQPKLGVEAQGGMNMCVYMLRPESQGTVLIRSDAPTALPSVRPNFATAQADRQAVLDTIRYAREFTSQAPLARIIQAETRPGPDYQSDEELRAAYRKFGYANYHASGTCRMGTDPSAVLDSRLRVRGVEGVRVADTSAFPFLLAGNTNGPAMAVAWRAADLILEDAGNRSPGASSQSNRPGEGVGLPSVAG